MVRHTTPCVVAHSNPSPVWRALNRHGYSADVVSNVSHVTSNDDQTTTTNKLSQCLTAAFYQVTCYLVAITTTTTIAIIVHMHLRRRIYAPRNRNSSYYVRVWPHHFERFYLRNGWTQVLTIECFIRIIHKVLIAKKASYIEQSGNRLVIVNITR